MILNFFSGRNRATALGMYSPLYFVTLFIILSLVTIFLILSRKMKRENVTKTIVIIGIFLWITEFGKMIFTGIRYGIEDVEFLPLYFCSMTMYSCIMILFKNQYIKDAALAFMFFGGIIGAVAFFCYPNACIPNYPLFHYMTLRTFIYHGSMLYMGFLIIITGYYSPKFKHIINYSIYLGIVFLLAYIINKITGSDLMYISNPLEISISQNLYNLCPNLYPFIFGILEIVGPFSISYGVYLLIKKGILHEKQN